MSRQQHGKSHAIKQQAEDRLRPALLAGADLVGRASSRHRALPSLLISGGQRCGTTSMYKALVQHPTIFRPTWRKGVHYFDVGYDHGLDWYRSHFPLQRSLERSATRHDTNSLCFESSPYYLYHPLAAERIGADLPDVKVLVLVRDPVERAYSAHAHEVARGFETLSFTDALEAEAERVAGTEELLRRNPAASSDEHRHHGYRSRGEYATHLERLAGTVGHENLRVVDSHGFFATPEPIYHEVLSWLGVRPIGTPTFDQHNARARTTMPDDVRASLETHFRPFDEALGRWLGRTPSWRR